MSKDRQPNYLVVGKFTGVYGIKGWLKVFSYTDPLENILGYKPWLFNQQGQWRELPFLQGKRHGKGLVVQIAGFENPETARALVGTEIAITSDRLPKLAKNEYYWSDLVGLTVINQTGITLGQVKEILATGANDVLVVQGEKRHLVPFLMDHTIVAINLEKQHILVDWDADF
jgi:16S rRNA processing protein RimM